MFKSITISALREPLLQKTIQLIDVRESEPYTKAHLPGALNIPLAELVRSYQDLDPDQDYYIICQRGQRSEQACTFLADKGYQVTNIEGGTEAWDGPLERGSC